MAGKKGRSGRRARSVEQKRFDIIDKAWNIVADILNDTTSSLRLQTAHDIVLKDITIKMEGKSFGNATNIYNLINQIRKDFISKDSEPSLALDGENGLDTRRTRPDISVQEISKQGLS